MMKLKYPEKSKNPATAAALALLLAAGVVGTANAAPPGQDEGYASIGISNVCTLEQGSTDLVVETTIIDKTLDKTKPGSEPQWGVVDPYAETLVYSTSVQAQQHSGKRKGQVRWSNLGDPVPLNNVSTVKPKLSPVPNTTIIDLCAADFNIDDNTVALNASISVQVINSRKGGYETSQCSGDKLKVSGMDINSDCASAAP
jgi:hypothetical protein